MTILLTYLFLVALIFTEIPLIILAWHLWRRTIPDVLRPIDHLADVILKVTLSKITFYSSWLLSIVLGLLGLSQMAQIPLTVLLEGTMVLVMCINWWSFVHIRAIIKEI